MYDSKSHFLKHSPCPRCGSKDNLAVYSSGTGFCFGCGFFQKRTELPRTDTSIPGVGNNATSHQLGELPKVRSYPDDAVLFYPTCVVEWIAKYDLEPRNLMEHNVYWSPKREQLLYTFYGEGEDVVLWQARNFRQGTTHKQRFFTGGSPEAVIAKYHYGESRSPTCVVVEDCISGLKVSYSGRDGVPCFSSTMSKEKLARLAKLYSNMIVWLDHDKYNEAQKIATQGAALGMRTKVVYTEDDPKIYSIAQIKDFIAPL